MMQRCWPGICNTLSMTSSVYSLIQKSMMFSVYCLMQKNIVQFSRVQIRCRSGDGSLIDTAVSIKEPSPDLHLICTRENCTIFFCIKQYTENIIDFCIKLYTEDVIERVLQIPGQQRCITTGADNPAGMKIFQIRSRCEKQTSIRRRFQ